MLFNQKELQALATLLNRTPMTPAEMLWANEILGRLVVSCQPPEPELTEKQAMADALAIAEALDKEEEK